MRVDDLKMHFPIYAGLLRRQVGAVKAVDGVTFDIYRGETLGLVGESGCGKSTTGRAMLRLYDPTDGEIYFEGGDIAHLSNGDMRRMRPRMQMIFQDPQACLNPRMTVGSIIAEPLVEHRDMTKEERKDRVRDLLNAVGLNRISSAAIPMNFQAANASALVLRGRWRSIPISSSATNRLRHWTCRSRLRWSICWRTCRKNAG